LNETNDDSGQDILNGGDGDDLILLGATDTATGGEGHDTFATVNNMITATDGPATITDYNGTDDSIEVLYRNTDGAPTVSVTANAAGDALVSLDGIGTFVVTGAGATLSASDIVLLEA